MGEYVTTSSKVATIMRIDPIKLALQVPEAQAAQLRPGMPVRAEVSAYPGHDFLGRRVGQKRRDRSEFAGDDDRGELSQP